jgi:GTP-binding protein
MTVSLPVLAIVGRPNVGKSALFNRIAGKRIAIVHEQAGVTRDRVSARARWGSRAFEVVDTGGIAFMDDERTTDLLADASRRQAEVAMEMASVILFVVDVTAGVTPLDMDMARRLRRSGKQVILAINKVDNPRREKDLSEFARLGFPEMFPIAAVHGLGMDMLLDEATKGFPAGAVEEETKPTRIAIVGRPNVGKSSLINSILQSERSIVSDVPGTTRDSVDVPFEVDGKPYVLVDTAGLRHKRKIKTSVDQFGLMRAERSIQECDIAVMVLDATTGVTKQDKHIAGQVAEASKCCLIVVNKWDLMVEAEAAAQKQHKNPRRNMRAQTYREQFMEMVHHELFFLDWASVLFLSALKGTGVDQIFGEVRKIEEQMTTRITTPELNRLLARSMESYPPPAISGKRFKIYYAFQRLGLPPTITMFVNGRQLLTQHYERFLKAKIRSVWAFQGCPLRVECRERDRRKFVAGLAK